MKYLFLHNYKEVEHEILWQVWIKSILRLCDEVNMN